MQQLGAYCTDLVNELTALQCRPPSVARANRVHVDRNNWLTYEEEILASIRSADFVAIDYELSGISSSGSLFDTAADRYALMRVSVRHHVPVQLGVCCMRWTEGRVMTVSYTFPIAPPHAEWGSNDYTSSTSSDAFLLRHNVDTSSPLFFESAVDAQRRSDVLEMEGHDALHGDVFKKRAIEQAAYRVASGIGDVFTDDDQLVYDGMHPFDRLTLMASVVQRAVPSVERTDVMLELVKRIASLSRGVATVVDEILRRRRPLLVHNGMYDLMHTYQSFVGPLPASYEEWKEKVHTVMPVVYDTKHLAYNCRFSIEQSAGESLGDSLGNLFEQLTRIIAAERRDKLREAAVVRVDDGAEEGNGLAHDAGHDAYMTAVLFVRLMQHRYRNAIAEHIRANKEGEKEDGDPPIVVGTSFAQLMSEHRPIDTRTSFDLAVEATPILLDSLLPFVNRVNMIQCTLTHISLDGIDPSPKTMSSVRICAKPSSSRLSVARLTSELSSLGDCHLIVLDDGRTAECRFINQHSCDSVHRWAARKECTFAVVYR